jgi:nicotianamine synthase
MRYVLSSPITDKPHILTSTAQVLSHPDLTAILPSLRQICAQAESCLELHWAEHIIAGGPHPEDVLSRLRSFPYYDNYEELTRLELCAILSATKLAPRRVAFIGSGPLPLTSLCLLKALKHDAQLARLSSKDEPASTQHSDPIVLNIDCDASAIAASLALCLALGETARGMEFVCAEATAPILPASSTTTTTGDAESNSGSTTRDLAEFDLVYMAALVGMSQADKERIIRRIAERMRPGALLVARSSWGMRTCLYPEVDLATEGLRDKLECCVVVHPYGQVVNSVIVAKVRG